MAGGAAQAAGINRAELEVCADPANMPFSNEQGQGFENRLAELIAKKLDVPLSYTWFPEDTGLVPNTLGNASCDLVMGYAQGTGLIEDTNPYYYTSYVLLYRQDDGSLVGVESLSDERLANKKIGVFARTPPMSIMAINGLMGNAKTFEMTSESGNPTADMIQEIASGQLDAGILWGPLGGYYAKDSRVPLTLAPLVKEKAGPLMVYGITMGVRPGEPEWKHTINTLIAKNQADINTILLDYNIPLLDQDGMPIEGATAER